MAKTQEYQRQHGDTVRINLSGEVADAVVDAASQLGISYSAYVQLRLQGLLAPAQTKVVHFEPVRTESTHRRPERTLAVLPAPPQTASDEPENQSVSDWPPL